MTITALQNKEKNYSYDDDEYVVKAMEAMSEEEKEGMKRALVRMEICT